MTIRTRASIGVLAIGLLGVAACGSGDDGEAATSATIDADVREGVQGALGASTTEANGDEATEPRPTTMEEWEELWAEERAAVVARIAENGWGVSADGSELVGPGGFRVDLAACPAGWSPTEGLTDTEIKIGVTGALSGPQGDYGNILRGGEAVFKYYSDQGVFVDSEGKDRRVTLIMRDDAYDPARTIPLVDELIDSEKVFAMNTQQSAGSLKTYDKLNERCIPQVFSQTGHPGLGDPVNHPWTTGSQMAYNTEAVLWGAFIEEHLDELGGSAKVAALVTTNDFGAAYDSGFEAFLAQSPNADKIEYVTERVEPSAVNLKDPMTTIAAGEPDVFIGMLVGTPCSQAMTESAENGMHESVPYKFISSVCKASSFVGRDKVGDASDGWWVMGGGQKDINAPAYDDDAFIVWARQAVRDAGYDPSTSGSFGSGLFYYWAYVQALRIAGDLPGGLTRPNFLLAARTMDMTHPFLLEGIRFNMDGNDDAYPVEGSDVSVYDSAAQAWVQDGPAIDLSGQSDNCAWDASAGICT